EEIGSKWRIDLPRLRPLEGGQGIDGLAIQPNALLAIVVQQIEKGLIADVDLQQGSLRIAQDVRNASVRPDGLVGRQELLELPSDLTRVIRQHPRRAVREMDAEVAPYRSITGQRLHRPLIATAFPKKCGRL